jgi:hypothetical protein
MSEERRRKQMERMADEAVAKATHKPWWESAWAVFGAVVALASAYVTFYPRPVLTPNENPHSNPPLQLILRIGNNNIIPLEDVRVSVEATEILTTDNRLISNMSFGSVNWFAPRLAADDRFDIDISHCVHMEERLLASADIRAKINYRSWFIPWNRVKEFPFRARKQPDGSFRFMAIPAG